MTTHTLYRTSITASLEAQDISFDPMADTCDLHVLLSKLGECAECPTAETHEGRVLLSGYASDGCTCTACESVR